MKKAAERPAAFPGKAAAYQSLLSKPISGIT
jgi:hypothetical protein